MYQTLLSWNRIINVLGLGGGERDCRKMILSDAILLV